ncbi:TetR/AcrR family transcriptional regulator [Streptosporangium sp. 'caverna']|uniref:TetR/AcrR family transcriptional regulator n=1 Tax=Streptosporangium sp. 'caverna' TaxID=2202249 RepID=UPI000D7D6C3C|nr:TetR/AcrR family transcriptional regulator [Streptosporangium sp. 'caverna']AWS43124.1 TetR/AcrR family transcriptional regulator [Streptosporangium sp. 'caverna']
MASTTRNRRDDSEQPTATEVQLLAAVERLLKTGHVFTEISVRQIIEEAGVSRASFYTHFRDKAQLLLRLSDSLRSRLLEMAREWNPGAGEDGADRYAKFFVEVIAIHRENFAILSALRELASYDPTVRGFYTADLEGFDEAVHKTLVAEQEAGRTPSDLDAVASSRVIVWGGSQAIARHISVDDGSGDAALARELGKIWWYGAYRRPGE